MEIGLKLFYTLKCQIKDFRAFNFLVTLKILKKISLTHINGGGAEHNNMPPYLVVKMWKRIA